jgi:lipopolysaccharide transport system ATP-binding protein
MGSVIKVENLSKQYRLGAIGTGSISHDLNRWWHTLRGKENPYLKIGETNDRSKKGESEYVWSLKDINFEIEQGDAVGIIGRNGAGKSTLLKILSRVTGPTTGNLKVKGRIASLLEVGTGFHPELSGRENIFLNGAILGMRKHEIRRKFDEIIDFSGVERYIDTPVKRYSSGMYVRLAFAVAAHLESEILIVDEVLAVGDAEFQKKCLGKMNDVSKGEGRTVLFVSHNMAAVKNLCAKGILLSNGQVICNNTIPKVLETYAELNTNTLETNDGVFRLDKLMRRGNKKVLFKQLCFKNEKNNIILTTYTGDKLCIIFNLEATEDKLEKIDIGFSMHNKDEEILSVLYSSYQNQLFEVKKKGVFEVKIEIPDLNIAPGLLIIKGRITVNNEESDWPTTTLGKLNVEMGDFYKTGNLGFNDRNQVLIKGQWNFKVLNT